MTWTIPGRWMAPGGLHGDRHGKGKSRGDGGRENPRPRARHRPTVRSQRLVSIRLSHGMSQIQPRMPVTFDCLKSRSVHDSLPDTRTRLLRERVGTHLELHHLARRVLARLHVERRSGRYRRPDAATLPSSGIIDSRPSISCGTQRIRHAHGDELAVFQRQQCFVAFPVLIGTLRPSPSVSN